MPPSLCHPLPDEIVLGTIYGVAVSLALVRPEFSTRQSFVWLGAIVLAGYWVIVACDGLIDHDRLVPANHVFILGLLVSSCRWAAELNRRFEQCNRGKSNPSARQFGIGALLWLTTAVAIALVVVKQTSLIDRGIVYWSGLFVLVLAFSFAFSRNALLLIGVSGGVAIGLAMIDAYVVQPDKLGFASAMTRYAGLLFGMIAPRMIVGLGSLLAKSHIEFLIGLLARPKRVTDATHTLTQKHDAVASQPTDANLGSPDTAIDPTSQTQPTLRILC